MRRLTPAGVSTMMVVVVGLLVTAYFAKLMRAEESRGQPTAQPQVVESRSVPTATGTLEPGTVITAAHLAMGRVRADALAPDALVQEPALIGRTVKERIPPGSVIRFGQLFPLGERPLPTVPRGMRAVSIALRRGVAPLIGLKEGQYVDVYLTPRNDVSNAARFRGGMTLTLFRGVRLLAATQGASANEANDVATLELTPDQAAILILARERGNIALSYNPDGKGDGGIALRDRDRATLDEILGLPPDPAVTARPAGPAGTFTTEVYKGTTRSTRQFEERTKTENSPATSAPTDLSSKTPLWTRRSPTPSVPIPPPERVSIAPVQTTIR
jgi:pilus assembly protein CpaB